MGLKETIQEKLELRKEEERTQEHYNEKRDHFVKDVYKLYDNIEKWIKDYQGIEINRTKTKTITEQLVGEYSIDLMEIKILELMCTLEPVGLWIIGAPGRIDLILEGNWDEKYLILRDLETLEWGICHHRDKKNIQLFNQERLETILETWINQWG